MDMRGFCRAGLMAVVMLVGWVGAQGVPVGKRVVVNSLGMELVEIQAGTFQMGQALGDKWTGKAKAMEGGEWDEVPVHRVTISKAFQMGATEVTNAQYEQFDPGHRKLRGRNGFSLADDEPVVFVSWEEATGFCAWLSKKEGEPYRLPTEAEWEFACRAGTTTQYATGDTLPAEYWRAQGDYEDWLAPHKTTVSLRVKQAPPNAWGLYDMHGNVEEWCADWYGPYMAGAASDPVGRAKGICRVTRGGSHNTDVYYLRSANRLSAIPQDRSYMIGFRVVRAPAPETTPLPEAEPPLMMRNVSQAPAPAKPEGYDPAQPLFVGPRVYTKVPPKSAGPLFSFHSHDPAIIDCPNGDLLAIWFTTQREWSRELTMAGSRLRRGAREWEPASLFFDVADRNDHAPAFWRSPEGRLFHFNGTGVAGWGDMATLLRTSDDNGATWSAPRLIKPQRRTPMGCVQSVIKTREGALMVPLDGPDNSTQLLISRDDGKTWQNPADGKPKASYKDGTTGRDIAGIHGTLAQLANGDLYALGRGRNINGKTPLSLSRDLAETWTYAASEFRPVGGGQRVLLRRLNEGPLLFVGFTDRIKKMGEFVLGEERQRTLTGEGMLVKDAAGKERKVYGLYAALSFDEGKTWPVRRLVTPGGPAKEYYGNGWTKKFTVDDTHAEPLGYLAVTQRPDGRIELISSGLHYEFNLAWIKTPMPAEAKP
jgi:formylglycine-generating enzyme required for sulfatase activity